MVAFTALNIALEMLGAGIYMLFSVFTSYFFGYMSSISFFRPDLWEEFGIIGEYARMDGIVDIVISVILLVPFLLSYIFSKDHRGWLVVGLLFCILDFIMMFILVEINAGMILDIIAHIFVSVELIAGIIAGKRLSMKYSVEMDEAPFSENQTVIPEEEPHHETDDEEPQTEIEDGTTENADNDGI